MRGLPLVEDPYGKIGKRLGLSGDSVFQRMRKFKKEGLIKRINAVWNWQKLGYCSTLIGIKVPREKLKSVINFLNGFGLITHNYLRRHKINLWFTLVYKKDSEEKRVINGLKKLNISEILNLPVVQKIKLDTQGLL